MGTPYSETNDSGGGGELSSLVATLQASLEQSGKVHKVHYITWSASDITQTARPKCVVGTLSLPTYTYIMYT